MTLSALPTERRLAPRGSLRRRLAPWSVTALVLFACGQPQRPTVSPVDAAEEVSEELGQTEPYVPPAQGEPAADDETKDGRKGGGDTKS